MPPKPQLWWRNEEVYHKELIFQQFDELEGTKTTDQHYQDIAFPAKNNWPFLYRKKQHNLIVPLTALFIIKEAINELKSACPQLYNMQNCIAYYIYPLDITNY